MSQEIVLIDETGFADVGVRRHFCQFGVAESHSQRCGLLPRGSVDIGTRRCTPELWSQAYDRSATFTASRALKCGLRNRTSGSPAALNLVTRNAFPAAGSR